MEKGFRTVLLSALALGVLLFSTNAAMATCGKLYQLDLCVYVEQPTYPAHIEFKVYKGIHCDPILLKGESSMDFNWFGTYGENWNFAYDDVAFLTSAWVEGGMLRICATASGYDYGKFKEFSSFEVVVNGVSTCLEELPTLCCDPITVDEPLDGIPSGTWTIKGGIGSCLPPGNPGCPEELKLYELSGEHIIPLDGCVPDQVAFKVYKFTDDLRGSSTATWTGSGLTDIVCDDIACLLDATVDGDFLVVSWEASGWTGDGNFETMTSFEVDLGACGSYKLQQFETSCLKAVRLNTHHWICPGDFDPDNNVDCGNGHVIFTDGCGGCLIDVPIPTRDSNWSTFKRLY